MNTDYSIELVFSDEDPEMVIKDLKEQNAKNIKPENRHGVTGVEIALLFLLVSSGIFNLVKRVMRQFKCGVIVDARTKKVVIRKDCTLPRGSVTIFRKDGTSADYQETDDAEIEKYLKGLVS